MKSPQPPDMAALWKSIALPDDQEMPRAPAVSIGTVHGSVLSIFTTQPMPIADLWKQMSSQQPSGDACRNR